MKLIKIIDMLLEEVYMIAKGSLSIFLIGFLRENGAANSVIFFLTFFMFTWTVFPGAIEIHKIIKSEKQ